MKNKRLLSSLSFIDEKYVKEAEPKMKTSSASPLKKLGRVACFVLVIALSLYLFIPFSKKGPDLTAYQESEYFPLIETISDYRYKPSPYKNNFQYLTAVIGTLGKGLLGGFGAKDDDMADGAIGGAAPESNGSYVETTDNQVAGVIEADLQKRTDTHIFRISLNVLRVYKIDKENTSEVASFKLPSFEDEYNSHGYNTEMYLSSDGNNVTILKKYNDRSYKSKVGIMSIDVSDLSAIKASKMISIDGSYNSSRMVDGKLLLISEYVVNSGQIEYDKPETYVPRITSDGVTECIKFKDIIYPDKLTNMRYSVVTLMEEGSLEMLGANALLNFYSQIYVSESNVYVTREYEDRITISEENSSYVRMDKSDIVVLGYAGETLENKGIITVEGSIKDQYSMDEKDGYFRVVTSTKDYFYSDEEEKATVDEIVGDKRESASLTVFKLDTLEKIAEVKDFAPEGEEAVSVRFDGDTAYVCTAVVVTFTDPVYFFDLSDYSNITYTDTGEIDGFSSSLIQLGEGFLLGIGEEDWQYGKVEIYEERDGKVESVDKYLFKGIYYTDYKSYYIDRENNLFAFGIERMYDKESGKAYDTYLLLAFNGYEIIEVAKVPIDFNYAYRVRAFVDDGYLYITDDTQIKVVAIEKQAEE